MLDNYADILKYKLAVANVRKGDDPLRVAHTVRHLGDAYRRAKEWSLAEPCYDEALAIYRIREDRKPLDLANAIRGLAVLKDDMGAAEEAEVLWKEAHDLYSSLGIWAGVAGSSARLALLAKKRGDRQLSHKWLSAAIAAGEQSNDPEMLQYLSEVKSKFEI